jgi:hypothetical protein
MLQTFNLAATPQISRGARRRDENRARGNACGWNHQPEMDGTRELAIKSQRAADGHLLVSVSDTGVGLPPQLDQIFQRCSSGVHRCRGSASRIPPRRMASLGEDQGISCGASSAAPF